MGSSQEGATFDILWIADENDTERTIRTKEAEYIEQYAKDGYDMCNSHSPVVLSEKKPKPKYKRLRINEDGEKYVILEKTETGTCLQCPNCGEFYNWFRPHGAYCRGCGYKIVSPIDWIIKE